jgi:hypothetical protein
METCPAGGVIAGSRRVRIWLIYARQRAIRAVPATAAPSRGTDGMTWLAVRRALKRLRIPPAPQRNRSTWRQFLLSRAPAMLACH